MAEKRSNWGDWPARAGMIAAVAALVWGAAVWAVQVRATAAIVADLQPRVRDLEDWRHDVELRHQVEAEVRAEYEAAGR